jgi:hypothetical protein
MDQNGAALFLLVPELVDMVGDCSSSELLEIAGGLGRGADQDSGLEGFFKMLLVAMVGEVEPLLALEFYDARLEEFKGGGEYARTTLLSELAKRDPTLALSKVEYEGAAPPLIAKGRAVVARHLLLVDLEAGLKILTEENEYSRGLNGLVVAARDPQVNAELWRAANAKEAGEVRSDLFKALLQAEMLDRGMESVSAAFDRIEQLADAERSDLVAELGSDFVVFDPEWTMGFVIENVGDDRRAETLRRALSSWAESDYNAAGEWLGIQPPSEDRDAMISGFVSAVRAIDRGAAEMWATEIGDEATRAAALRGIRPEAVKE